MNQADRLEKSRQIPLDILTDAGDRLVGIYRSCGTHLALRDEVQHAAKHHFGITIHPAPHVHASVDNIGDLPKNFEGWKVMAHGFTNQIDRWCAQQLAHVSEKYPDPAQAHRQTELIRGLQKHAHEMDSIGVRERA